MNRTARFRIGRITALGCCCFFLWVLNVAADAIIINHNHTDITQIPQSAIEQAKANLHIAYGHTSHGSQLTTGMNGLVGFANGGGLGLSLPHDIFTWNNGGTAGALDLHDYAMGGDVGYYPQWVENTRTYLDNPANADVNVIIWSWCGQVGSKYASGTLESQYLTPMAQLEVEYPTVTFVYMTGHVDMTDGSNADFTVDTNTKAGNRIIREFCTNNDKVLYDFADIERYDPYGTYYEFVDDDCDYYSSPDGTVLGNWATEWQNSHTQRVDWYNCSSAHSQPLNANRKAYAAWWLWSVLGGWNPTGTNRAPVLSTLANQEVECDQLLEFTVTATDADSGDVLTYSTGTLPAGASFNATTGVFQWTPTTDDEGDHTVSFSVVDNGSPQAGDQQTITISVVPPGTGGGSGSGSNSSSDGCLIDCILVKHIQPWPPRIAQWQNPSPLGYAER